MPEQGQPTPAAAPAGTLRFGANYVPSSGWFYSWLDFSADDVRRDFADLASLGLDHVRIFPVWPWIQPNRGLIRSQAVRDVLHVMDCAAEFGLDVSVDLIQGHLSSFDFLPSWVLTWHQASVFTDRTARDGLARYVEVLAGAVASRPNLLALTLGNEVNNLWPANGTTVEDAHAWADELLQVARRAAPGAICVNSLYDDAWYAPAHPFAPAAAVGLGDLTSVHSWVFNGTSAIDGPLGPATTSHADYLVELAAAAGEPGRPVWLQELGAPAPDIPAALAGEFARTTLERAVENPSLWGVTWWCSHDIDPSLLDFPAREYGLGLFATDHSRKPVAAALAKLVESHAGPRTAAPCPGLVCDVDPRADLALRDRIAPGSAFHAAWVALRAQGPVAVVPKARAADRAYLDARGIDRLLLPVAQAPVR